MSKKLDTNAAYHAAIGALESKLKKSGGVATGLHDLSRGRMVITFPQGVMVNRGEGDLGDGEDAAKAPKTIPIEAALLFIQRIASEPLPESLADHDHVVQLWVDCLRQAPNFKAEDLLSEEAFQAMAILEKEAVAVCQKAPFGKRKTSAKRINVDTIEIELERLTKAEFQELPTG